MPSGPFAVNDAAAATDLWKLITFPILYLFKASLTANWFATCLALIAPPAIKTVPLLSSSLFTIVVVTTDISTL